MVTTETNGTPIIMGGDGMGSGAGTWVWAFLIFALLGGGAFGGFGNRGVPMGSGDLATKDDLANQFNFAALERQNNETVAAIGQAKYDVFSEIKQSQDVLGSRLNDLYSQTQNIAATQAQCCCETLRAIDGVNYNNALNTASINANTTAQTQKILDAISANKIEALQNEVNQLQLQNAMAGVVRYPNGWTYNAGTSPFCNGGCCGC